MPNIEKKYFKDDVSFQLYTLLVNSQKFPRIKGIFDWIYQNLTRDQVIRVYSWYDSYYYIDVELKNTKGISYPGYVQIGFSVNTYSDTIHWNSVGGNCFVRNLRWGKLLKSYFTTELGSATILDCVHFYSAARGLKINVEK